MSRVVLTQDSPRVINTIVQTPTIVNGISPAPTTIISQQNSPSTVTSVVPSVSSIIDKIESEQILGGDGQTQIITDSSGLLSQIVTPNAVVNFNRVDNKLVSIVKNGKTLTFLRDAEGKMTGWNVE